MEGEDKPCKGDQDGCQEINLNSKGAVILIASILTVYHGITLVDTKDTAGVVFTGDSVGVNFTPDIVSITGVLGCTLVHATHHVSTVSTQGLVTGTTAQSTKYTATIVTGMEPITLG